ncbi:hypothetical protein BOH72_16595 [Mycobacterium sp. WY10]|nr:hypothetical protein BOH72_16595 [Mycobacterium sp. WY10]
MFIAVDTHRGGAAQMLGGRPHRLAELRCRSEHLGGILTPAPQCGHILGGAVVVVFDQRSHHGIARHQRNTAVGPRRHQCHPEMRPVRAAQGAVTDHRDETARIGPDLDAIGHQHHLEHRPLRDDGPRSRQHPLRVVPGPLPYRKVGRYRDAEPAQRCGRPDSGQHQQVRRSDGARRHHDPVGLQNGRPVRTRGLDADHPAAGQPQPQDAGARQHGQVRPGHGRFQEGRTRPAAYPVDDVQRHRPDPGRCVIPGRLRVEVG